jgi:hypothetical protein
MSGSGVHAFRMKDGMVAMRFRLVKSSFDTNDAAWGRHHKKVK